jgi:hypothetical protein
MVNIGKEWSPSAWARRAALGRGRPGGVETMLSDPCGPQGVAARATVRLLTGGCCSALLPTALECSRSSSSSSSLLSSRTRVVLRTPVDEVRATSNPCDDGE